MAETFEPANVPRASVAQDPGVRMRPSTTLPSRIIDPIGESVFNLGREISSIADTFRALTVQRQGADDQVFLDKYQLELNKRYSAIESESANSPDTANPNYVNILDKRLQDTQKTVYDELTNSGQHTVSMEGRRKAEHAAMEMRAATARRSAIAAHNQRVTGYVNIVNENILEIGRVAGSNGDIEGNLARVDASVNSLNGVLAPDKLEALRRASRSTVVESVVQGMRARGQFDEARRLIDSERGYAANSGEAVIAAAASKYGIDPAYLVSTGRIESGMRNLPPSGDPNRTAAGVFQFTKGTARDYGLPENASTATVAQQADAAARLAASNKRVLVGALGRDPTNGELYLAHFLGAGDAAKVLSAPPGTPIEAVVGADSIKHNSGILRGRTVGDITRWAEGKMISFGGGGADRYLDDATRRRLMSAVETSQNQNEVRNEARTTKLLKEAGDGFMREAFSRIDKGELDSDFVEQIKPFVSPTEYKGLLTALRGENNVDDQEAIIDLQEKIDAENPDKFFERASDYLRNGQLKTTTFSSMIQRNRTARADDQPASPAKSGRQHIMTAIDPGAIQDATAASTIRINRGNAIQEYDNWVQANPTASREAAMGMATDIVQRYQPIPYQNIKMGLGVSRYFGVRTRNEVTPDHVRKAYLALGEDRDNNRLSQAQLLFEKRLIDQWNEVLITEQQRRDAPQPKKK
jgi:hypothetical protein